MAGGEREMTEPKPEDGQPPSILVTGNRQMEHDGSSESSHQHVEPQRQRRLGQQKHQTTEIQTRR